MFYLYKSKHPLCSNSSTAAHSLRTSKNNNLKEKQSKEVSPEIMSLPIAQPAVCVPLEFFLGRVSSIMSTEAVAAGQDPLIEYHKLPDVAPTHSPV